MTILVNDSTVMGGIITLLLMMSLIIPAIQSEFGDVTQQFNKDSLTANLTQENLRQVDSPAGLKSIGKMFLWTFGDLPLWLDLLLLVPRIILYFILARNLIPFLGGG